MFFVCSTIVITCLLLLILYMFSLKQYAFHHMDIIVILLNLLYSFSNINLPNPEVLIGSFKLS